MHTVHMALSATPCGLRTPVKTNKKGEKGSNRSLYLQMACNLALLGQSTQSESTIDRSMSFTHRRDKWLYYCSPPSLRGTVSHGRRKPFSSLSEAPSQIIQMEGGVPESQTRKSYIRIIIQVKNTWLPCVYIYFVY